LLCKVRCNIIKDKKDDGSLEIKISNSDIKSILGRQRIRKGLRDNLVKDLNSSNIKTSSCDSNSLCVIIPKDKLEKTIIKYNDIK
jgi:hypothetical protein